MCKPNLFPGDSTLLNYFNGRDRIAGAYISWLNASACIDTVVVVAMFIITCHSASSFSKYRPIATMFQSINLILWCWNKVFNRVFNKHQHPAKCCRFNRHKSPARISSNVMHSINVMHLTTSNVMHSHTLVKYQGLFILIIFWAICSFKKTLFIKV
jgi:hypothetical protein